MSDLFQVQQDFVDAIRDSRHTASLLAHLDGESTRNAALIAVYRGNATHNAINALKLAYPVCAQLVGEDCFTGLARLYWRTHPPLAGDWNEYGAGLAALIAAQEDLAALPWLSELAQIEWAVHQAARVEDHHALRMEALRALTPEQLGETSVRLQPALQIIHSPWPIASIWQQHQTTHQGDFDLSGRGAESAALYREGFAVRVSALSVGEAACLRALQAGARLNDAFQAALAVMPELNLAICLQHTFARQLIIDLIPGATK